MFFEWLKNKQKERFYPITHASGVLYGEDCETTVDTEITRLKDHASNTDIHITAEERTKWNDANAYNTKETVIGTFGNLTHYRKVIYGSDTDFTGEAGNRKLVISNLPYMNYVTKISAVYYDGANGAIYDMAKDIETGQGKFTLTAPVSSAQGTYTVTLEYAR